MIFKNCSITFVVYYVLLFPWAHWLYIHVRGFGSCVFFFTLVCVYIAVVFFRV